MFSENVSQADVNLKMYCFRNILRDFVMVTLPLISKIMRGVTTYNHNPHRQSNIRPWNISFESTQIKPDNFFVIKSICILFLRKVVFPWYTGWFFLPKQLTVIHVNLPVGAFFSQFWGSLPPVKKIKYKKILTYILRSIFLEIPHLELPRWRKT